MKYAFNGRFLTKKMTGQERYASELISHLDKICEKGEFCVVTSELVEQLPKYENIEIVQTGRLKREAWEQFCLGPWLRRHKMKCVNLTTTFAFGHAEIVCIHDVSIFEIGRMFMHSAYGFFGTLWKMLLCKVAAWRSEKILTVSEYSKKRLNDLLGIPMSKLSVVYNSWQHFEKVQPDEAVMSRFGLSGGGISSLSVVCPHKRTLFG